mmetsp:Transcript_23392/g.20337  ORF Transcript_23392/g.20337 Transcript_23392/m.20337 type:complete len:134 (+) Transcript_23392:620-1021(+)
MIARVSSISASSRSKYLTPNMYTLSLNDLRLIQIYGYQTTYVDISIPHCVPASGGSMSAPPPLVKQVFKNLEIEEALAIAPSPPTIDPNPLCSDLYRGTNSYCYKCPNAYNCLNLDTGQCEELVSEFGIYYPN